MPVPAAGFALLEAILRHECAGQRVCFRPNPGNAGDGVIAAATYQLLDDLGIRTGPCSGGVQLLGGGGNLVPEYAGMRRLALEALASDAKRIILLPHGIRGNDDVLSALDERCIVFCRDEEALRHVRRRARRAAVHFCHDLAFRLRHQDLPRASSLAALRGLIAISPRKAIRFAKWLAAFPAPAAPPPHGELRVLRGDRESRRPADERSRETDITGRYNSDFRSREEARLVTARLIHLLAPYRRVVTDRLHVGIVSCVLGKEVELHDNSYGKNRSVFEASIAGRYPNVAFAA